MTMKEAMVRCRRNHELFGGNWEILTRRTEEGRQLWIRMAGYAPDMCPGDALVAFEYPKPQ